MTRYVEAKDNWTYEFKCKKCQKRAVAESSDIYFEWVEDYCGWHDEGGLKPFVDCVCGHTKQVSAGIPKHIKRRRK